MQNTEQQVKSIKSNTGRLTYTCFRSTLDVGFLEGYVNKIREFICILKGCCTSFFCSCSILKAMFLLLPFVYHLYLAKSSERLWDISLLENVRSALRLCFLSKEIDLKRNSKGRGRCSHFEGVSTSLIVVLYK
jgi:hypothetical protein